MKSIKVNRMTFDEHHTMTHWQLTTPINAIAFDCDGTLSKIEGIDELAKYNGVSEPVQALTKEAMSKTGLNPTVYEQRLLLVKPKQEQIFEVGKRYIAEQIPDIKAIIAIFTRLKKSVYILSAGLSPSVTLFAEALHIPRTHVFAVDLTFDTHGHYVDFDRNSPLVHNEGKRQIVNELKTRHPQMIYVGDGLNDLSTIEVVTRFVGYGGVFYRDNIAAKSPFYITTLSPTALLPLSLTQEEVTLLSADENNLYQQGLDAINQHQVLIR